MRTLEQQLSNYAAYHRDRRNIATHFIGIPMIVVSVFALSARAPFGLSFSPALVVFFASAAFYLSLDVGFGLAMAVVNLPALYAGMRLAALPTTAWLIAGVGLFVVGWVAQFIGHAFEGKKPAFVDDIVGLLIGPLFLVAETVFAVGLRRPLHAAIERTVGPTRIRRPDALPSASVGANAQPG
jgi:uncharacterized membrane protein YGL010W